MLKEEIFNLESVNKEEKEINLKLREKI